MTPGRSIFFAGAVAAILSVAFALLVRLPLPFDGFAILAAAGLAGLGTLAAASLMPARWVWTDAERIRLAFQARHGLSDVAAGSALVAITSAHDRARALRAAATGMREDVAPKVTAVADRLDAAAREIFYEPSGQRSLRGVLVRAELIEDAATAHVALRQKADAAVEEASRQKLLKAVTALDAAFEETDLMAAKGLLREVEVASDVAERLLTPRQALSGQGTSSYGETKK
ncbi:MAG: hypothetical protein AAGF78_01960 [Pseudomonadota bacterium]